MGLVSVAFPRAYGYEQLPPYQGDPRITLNLRVGTSHGSLARRIRNAREAVAAIDAANVSRYPTRIVVFDQFPIYKQLEILTNTDVMMGAHGAGQTLASQLKKCAVNVEMFGYGGGGGCPGSYAGARMPYLAWEDDTCPPDI
eukprot:7381449-Prymnesium_polylepis.1